MREQPSTSNGRTSTDRERGGPGYVGVSTAAQRAGLSINTIHRLIHDGRLPAFRITDNGPWLIPDHAVPTIPELASRNKPRMVNALVENLERLGVHVTINNGDPGEAA